MTKGCQPNKTYRYGTWNRIRHTEILQLLCSGHNFTPSLWSCLTVFHLFYFKSQPGGNLRGFPLQEANTLKRWLHLEEKQIPASYLSLLKNCEHFQVAKGTKDQTEFYSTFRSYGLVMPQQNRKSSYDDHLHLLYCHSSSPRSTAIIATWNLV